MAYSKAVRPVIAGENPGMTFSDLSRKTGEKWKELSDRERKRFEKIAETDKARFEKEMENYVPPASSSSSSESSSEESGSSNGKKKKKKSGIPEKKKRKKDPNAPKKAQNAYLYFVQAKRKQIHEQDPSLSTTNIMKAVGEQWRALSDEDKTVYNEQARKDKERFEREKADYFK